MPYWFYRYAVYIFFPMGVLVGLLGYWGGTCCKTRIVFNLFWFAFITFLGVLGWFLGRLVQKLHQKTDTDPLTQLGNRQYFYRKLAEEIERMRRTGLPLSVAMLDVDDFKQVNDTQGHYVGDQVLIKIADVFKQNARTGDSVVRWGGDEFAIIFPNTAVENAEAVIARIRKRIETAPDLCGVTISAGLVPVSAVSDISPILIKADQLLYKAKMLKNPIV